MKILLSLILFISKVLLDDEEIVKKLKFDSNKEFKILHLTDLHLSNCVMDFFTLIQVRFLLKKTKPDLVILGGDIINGNDWDGFSKDFAENNWKKITDILLEEKILYAYAFGNHDVEAGLTFDQLADLEKKHPYSMFKGDMSTDPESASNYVLKIFSSFENKENEVSSLIWIFDSKRFGCLDIIDSYGCITKPQIDWYKEHSKTINIENNKDVFGLSFLHIPIVEFLHLWNNNKTYGNKNENVSCPKKNTGFFNAVKKNIRGIYVGHDHDNDFGGDYEGVDLAYNRISGYGSYGDLIRGARVFKLKEFINEKGFTDFTFQHHIIEFDGTIVYNQETTSKDDGKKKQIYCVK